jgi:O-antigen/teichoic acid export membrane protein
LTSGKRFLFSSIASIFDQALLSLLNFIVGIALIRLASKEAYGLYTLLFSAGLLSTALLDALIGSALSTIAPRLPDQERTDLISRVARLYWAASLGVALLFGLGADIGARSAGFTENPEAVGIAFALFIASLSTREFCRTALFTNSKAVAVAKLDSLFFGLTVVSAFAYVYFADAVTIFGTMLVLAFSNGVAGLIFSIHWWKKGLGVSRSQLVTDIQMLWRLSRWAFAGAVNGWLGNNAYLYFAGVYISVEASADLNAARLLLVPVALLSMAWSRVAKPAAGRLIAQNNLLGLEKFAWQSIGALVTMIFAFSVVLVLVLPWLQTNLLGPKYQEAIALVPLWALYFMVNGARAVGTTFLMSYGWYRVLFWQGSISLGLLAASCLILMPKFGIFGALCAMIIVESIEFLTNMTILMPKAKRKHSGELTQTE